MGEVISFDVSHRPARPKGDLDCQIRQEDLEELKQLGQRADQAVQDWKHLNDRILWMLLNDYPVEPGARRPRVIPVKASSYQVNRRPYFRLKVD